MLDSSLAWDAVTFLPDDHIGLTQNPVFTDNLLFYLLEQPPPTPLMMRPRSHDHDRAETNTSTRCRLGHLTTGARMMALR